MSSFQRVLADLKGVGGMRASPGGPNSLNFIQFSGKFGKIVNRILVPPWRVGAPTSGKSWFRPWCGCLDFHNCPQHSTNVWNSLICRHCRGLKRKGYEWKQKTHDTGQPLVSHPNEFDSGKSNINTMNAIKYWAIAVNNEELLQHVEGRTRAEYILIKRCLILAKNNENNICLTSLTRAKPKEKMEFPA